MGEEGESEINAESSMAAVPYVKHSGICCMTQETHFGAL